MGRFSRLGQVKTNAGGLYFLKSREEGGQVDQANYLVCLDEIKLIEANAGHDTFIISAIVEESDNPERKVGCKPSQVIPLKPGNFLDTYLGNVKAAAAAFNEVQNPDDFVAEVDPKIPGDTPESATERYWDELLEFITSDEQPLKGMRVRLNCTTIVTKGKKQPFTKHTWGEVVSRPWDDPVE